MKEKFLYASFMTANLADVASTKIGLNMSLTESSSFAASYIESGYDDHFFMAKIGISAVLIGLAAIAREKNKNSKADFVLNKSVQYTNLIIWGTVAINTAQIISQMQ